MVTWGTLLAKNPRLWVVHWQKKRKPELIENVVFITKAAFQLQVGWGLNSQRLTLKCTPCIWPNALPIPEPRPSHPPPVQNPWGRILVLTSADWILTSQSMFPLGGDTGAAKGQTHREDMQERSRPSGNWTWDLLAARLKGAKRCANCQATEVTHILCEFRKSMLLWHVVVLW